MEFIKTIDEVPEHLKCPICTEIPRDKVFQCANGHTICEECSQRLTSCPQCRFPFEPRRIRSLVVENMLEELKLDCPFKKYRCSAQLTRKHYKRHLEDCCYNLAKFGPFHNVCQMIGFKNCTFLINKGNTDDAIKHFVECHEAKQCADIDVLLCSIKNSKDSRSFKLFGFGSMPDLLRPPCHPKTFGTLNAGFSSRIQDSGFSTPPPPPSYVGSHSRIYKYPINTPDMSLESMPHPIIFSFEEYFIIILLYKRGLGLTLGIAPFFLKSFSNADFEINPVLSLPKIRCCIWAGAKKYNIEIQREIDPVDMLDFEIFPDKFIMPITSCFEAGTSAKMQIWVKRT